MRRGIVRGLGVVWMLLIVACGQDRSPVGVESAESVPMAGPTRDLMAAVEPTDQQLIVFERMEIDARVVRDIENAGGEVVREYPQIGMLLATGLESDDLATLRSNRRVLAAARDVMVQWIPTSESAALSADRRVQMESTTVAPQVDQTDAFFYDAYQWYLPHIKVDKAYRRGQNGDGTLVCVLDSGIDPGQQDLNGKVDYAMSFIPYEPFIEDINFHGTAVAGLISSNGLGTASVAPGARLCALKVLDASGSGTFDWFIQALLHAHQIGADVANASLGVYVDESFLSDPDLHDLVEAVTRVLLYVRSRGMLVVTSAGNDGIDLDGDPLGFLYLPGQLPGAMSVGATSPVLGVNPDTPTTYTNTGVTGVDVAAGGGDYYGSLADLVLAPCSRYVCGADGFYVFAGGTSFSAPLVAGAAAIAFGEGGHSPDHVQYCLETTARQPGGQYFFSNEYGRGIVNVSRAASKCS